MKYLSRVCVLLAFLAVSCSSSEDLVDLVANPPERKEIDVDRLGVNNFFVAPQFGTTAAQYLEMRDKLGIRFVRVLFAWTDSVQPAPGVPPFYGFYDEIVASVPPGVDIIPVLVHTPSWIEDPDTWIGGNPRTTWIERWLRPTVERYAGDPAIIGWEVWNEPDLTVVPSDIVLGLEDPSNYIELLNAAQAVIRVVDPVKLVVGAATESIQQDFPNNLDYNKRMRDLGAESLLDVWNIHYYGEQFERVLIDGGVADFLNSLSKPIWITESGEPGPNGQLPFAETVWPFLREQIPGITRIYYYRFANNPGELPYGLRQNGEQVSDLYLHLEERENG